MSRRTSAILGVAIMSVALVLYFVFAVVRAVALLSTGTPIAVAMGLALIVLPLIGFWALGREIFFGWKSTALIDRLDAEDLLPDDLGETGPTGKADREIADAAFARYRDAAEADPENWRAWVRLGVVYDACGDRKRAREAMREAISIERVEARHG